MHYDDELFDEEKEISIDELVEALSGEDEDGDPKSVVECSLYKVETTEDGTLEKINEMTSFTADKGNMLFTLTITNIECAVDYYLTLSNPAAYLKGLSKDNRPVIVQLVFAADLVNAVACDFDLEEIKAEALREMESDEKSQLEDEAMNESVMAMINEGTPMDENYFLNQNHVEEPSNKHRIRSTEHTDLSNVRRSELDLDKTGIRGKE